MKLLNKPFRILLLVFLICQVQQLFAQIPQQINYQGALRDSKGNPIVNQQITLRLSIQDQGANGLVHYNEVRSVKTNAVGLYTVAIGSPGALDTKGNFSTIPWGISPKFLKVEVDPEGGYTYMNAGLTQLLSVPYSLYAKYAENGPIGPTGPAGPAGANGLSAFEIWQQLPGNAGKTLQEYVDGLTGADGRSVTGAQLDAAGNLVLTFSDNTTTNVGQVIGPAGVQGLQGTDGRSVTGAQLDAAGNLVLTFSDNTTTNVGQVIGPAGPQGLQGADGRSITGAQLDAAGNLIIAFSDNTTSNVGQVTGPAGPAGPQGIPGTNGISVQQTQIDANGHLIITLSNGTVFDAGQAVGTIGPQGPTGPQGPAGFNCWDANLNGLNDPSEDTNGDGIFNTLDCAAASSTLSLTDGHIFVGNSANLPADVPISGDATIVNSGLLTITNGAITLNKMANGTPDMVYVTNTDAVPSLTSFNGMGWSLKGNTGTSDPINFIGTTDDQPLNFRINNEKAGRIANAVRGETTLGYRAGASSTGSFRNTLLGLRAGELLPSTTGRNTLIGALAGYQLIGGNSNQNTGVGQLVFMDLGTGTSNTAVGNGAGRALTAGDDNVFIGNFAGLNNSGVGSKYFLLGTNASANPGLTNAAAIGNNALVTTSNSMVLGGLDGNAVNIGIGTSAPTQKVHIKDGHIRSEQSTLPSVAFLNANGFTSVNLISGSTDVRGTIQFQGTSSDFIAYSLMDFLFNFPASNSPTVIITPANLAAANTDFYVVQTVNGFNFYFKGRSSVVTAPKYNYIIIE